MFAKPGGKGVETGFCIEIRPEPLIKLFTRYYPVLIQFFCTLILVRGIIKVCLYLLIFSFEQFRIKGEECNTFFKGSAFLKSDEIDCARYLGFDGNGFVGEDSTDRRDLCF